MVAGARLAVRAPAVISRVQAVPRRLPACDVVLGRAINGGGSLGVRGVALSHTGASGERREEPGVAGRNVGKAFDVLAIDF